MGRTATAGPGSLAWPSYLVVAVVSGLLVLVAADSRRRSLPFRRSAGHLHHAVEDLRGDQRHAPGWSAQMRRPCPVKTSVPVSSKAAASRARWMQKML